MKATISSTLFLLAMQVRNLFHVIHDIYSSTKYKLQLKEAVQNPYVTEVVGENLPSDSLDKLVL